MKIGQAIHRHRDAIAADIQQLVRIRSVRDTPMPGQPFGEGVDHALRFMLERAASFGFAVKHVDGYAGHAEYGAGEELAAVLVHLDTVHEGEGWTYPPFGGVMDDGKIIGRGASDNKGPAVVALYALKTLQELGIAGNRRLRVIFGTNEESGMQDLDAYFAQEPVPDLAFVPDAGYPIFNIELGNMNVVFSSACHREHPHKELTMLPILALEGGSPLALVPAGCKATVSLLHLDETQRLALQQRIAEAANISVLNNPDEESEFTLDIAAGNERVEGVLTGSTNAIANMAAFLLDLGYDTGIHDFLQFVYSKLGREAQGESLGIACKDEVSGSLVVFLRTISLDAERVQALCNIRYPVTQDGDRLVELLSEAAQAHDVRVELTRHLRPVHVPEDHPVIVKLSRAYEVMTGSPATLLRMGAGTYARKLQGRGVAFGAGLQGGVNTNVHGPDEFVYIDDMMAHAEICLQGMYELLID